METSQYQHGLNIYRPWFGAREDGGHHDGVRGEG